MHLIFKNHNNPYTLFDLKKVDTKLPSFKKTANENFYRNCTNYFKDFSKFSS